MNTLTTLRHVTAYATLSDHVKAEINAAADEFAAQAETIVKLRAALEVVANCIGSDQDGTTLGTYEMGVVRGALVQA